MRRRITVNEKLVSLTGDLSANRLDEIKELLLSELFEEPALHISISEVSALHLSTLQWIYAFSCAANTEGKRVIIKLDLPPKFDRLVKASGIQEKFNRFDQ